MPLPVNWNSTQNLGTHESNGVVRLGNGGYAVLTSNPHGSLPGLNFQVQLVNAAGEFSGQVLPLQTVVNDSVLTASIAAISSGGFFVATVHNNLGSEYYQLQQFTDQGEPTPFFYSVGLYGGVSDFSMTALSDGRFLMVWDAGGQVTGQILSSDYTIINQAFTPYSPGYAPAAIDVTATANGGFAIVTKGPFLVNPGIDAKVFTAPGEFSPGQQTGSSVHINLGMSDGGSPPQITTLANGTIAISFYRDVFGDFVQLITSTGIKLGSPFSIGNASGQKIELVALPEGGFFAIVPNSDVVIARYSATGQFLGTLEIDAQGGNLNGDTAAKILADGRIAVTWEDRVTSEIFTRIIDPRGAVTVNGTSGDDTLFGSATSDTLANQKVLVGGAGSDVLYGGGFDILRGGAGDDVLVLGTALVSQMQTLDFSDATSALTVDFAAGTASSTTTGNDIIFGQSIFRMIGGSGNDTFKIPAGEGSLYTQGIDGGAGADTLDASGFFTAVGSSHQGTFDLATGQLAMIGNLFPYTATLTNFENITGTDKNDTITGNQFANILDGGAGNDIINGGEGDDTISGGAGNDVLSGGDGIDTLSYMGATGGVIISLASASAQNTGAAAGTDTVTTFENITGSAFNDRLTGNLEMNLLVGGNGDDLLYGNEEDDILLGDAGDDFLDGGFGLDTMTGGLGNDTYVVDNDGDVIIEGFGHGTADVLRANKSYTLADGVSIETLYALSATGSTVTGNELDNILRGHNGAADILNGAGGRDKLLGNAGNDILSGGDEYDILSGGAGADIFVLSPVLGSRDRITDFVSGTDKLQISAALFGGGLVAGTLAAGQFVSNLTGVAGDGDDRFIYESDRGLLYYDANGNASGGRVLIASFDALPAITAADFVIV